MGVIGEEWILVRPETAGFVGKLKSSLLGQSGGLKGVGSLMGATVVAGVGVGLFEIGEKFEKTYNKIRVDTGATGATFEKLKGDVKNVLGSTAGSFDQVGAAISGLYARTGLTGKGLDDLAKRQVTLARITKTDVGGNVDATTKLFAKYGIAAADQGKYLDVLFKASQQAGTGIGDIIQPMLKGGSALQVFGFGIEKSAALIASLTKAGVTVQPALMALRSAFGKIAKEGGDPVAVLMKLQAQLLSGKDPAKAMADAMKLLGNRGGLELANAIKGGKFNLDAMLKTITDGKGGILETGSEVSTLGGKFQILKNKVLVALEPIATKIVDFANKGLKKVIDYVDRMGGLGGVFQKWKTPIMAAAIALGLLFAPFTTIAVGLAVLYQKNETFRNGVQAVVAVIQSRFIPAMQAVGQWITTVAIPALQRFADYLRTTVWPVVQQVAAFIVGKFGELVQGVQSRWNDIKQAIHNVLLAIKIVVAVELAPLLYLWRHFHTQILGIVHAVWNTIRSVIHGAFMIIKGVFDVFLGLLSGHWGRAWDGIKTIVSGAWELIAGVVTGGFRLIQGIFDIALGALVDAWNATGGKVVHAVASMIATVIHKVGGILSYLTSLPGKMIGALGDIVGKFLRIGEEVIEGIIKGITSKVHSLLDKVGSVIGSVKDALTSGFGILSPSKVTAEYGRYLMEGLAVGIDKHAGKAALAARRAVANVSGAAASGLGAGGGAFAPGAGRGFSGRGYVTIQSLVLAPVFPPGMNESEIMRELETFATETIADAVEGIITNTGVGAGTNR